MTEGDPDAHLRAIAAGRATIARFLEEAKEGNFSRLDELIALVSRDEWQLVDAASYAIERLGPTRAREALVNASRVHSEPIYALVSIGTPAVVPRLVELLGDEELEFREHGRRALCYVLGDRVSDLLEFDSEDLGDEHAKVSEWWAAHARELDPHVVYNRGEPFDLSWHIEMMVAWSANGGQQELAALEALAKKAEDFTGHRIEGVPARELAAHWHDWWRANGSRFQKGRRYFYGHLVE